MGCLNMKTPKVGRTRKHFTLRGEAGEVLSLSEQFYDLFRGDYLVATDSSKRPGYGTEFSMLIGERFQVGHMLKMISTSAFAASSPADLVEAIYRAREMKLFKLAQKIELDFLAGIDLSTIDLHAGVQRDHLFDTWQPGLVGTLSVKFLETCQWDATLFGIELKRED